MGRLERDRGIKQGEREGGGGDEMTFELVKSGSNMASCSTDQEGHYSIFRRLMWECDL